jgi:hypothetical protein
VNPQWCDRFQVVYLSALRTGDGSLHGLTSYDSH